jgi:hypothetical protein
MITTEDTTHRIELDDKTSVVDLLAKSLENPNFNNFSIYVAQDWPVGGKKTYYYNVSVELKFKSDDNKTGLSASTPSAA